MTQPPRPQASDRPNPAASGRRADLITLAVALALVATAAVVGALLNTHGVRLHADAAPLYASWFPHIGWGTPIALAVAGVVVRWGPDLARRAPWRRLLALGYVTAVAWILGLALIDGWSTGLARRLTPQAEYLNEVPRVTDIPAMLAGFTDRILDFQPGSWSTHTAGHPPGALLVFVWLDRLGLGGGAPAALLCVLVGATVTVSVPVALRWLGDEPAARAVLPFLVLLPGAVWIGASADGIFTGVVAAGLALLARPGRWTAVPAGLLLGFGLYLSYGFVLVGLLAGTVLVSRSARARPEPGAGGDERRRRVPTVPVWTLVAAGGGVLAVVAVFTLAGFDWWRGYRLVAIRYDQGWAGDRPYGYWVWANLAALLCSTGPAVAPALRRVVAGLRVAFRRPGWGGPVTWLPLAATVTVLAADASGLSKAEVERIWLPFAVWLLVAVARLPARHRRWWLAGQAVTALVINHLLLTVS